LIVLNQNPHPFKTGKGAAPKGHPDVFVGNGISARGFLRGEHSIRGMCEMRSNGVDADQVVEAVGFIPRKCFFAN
jgi:hypothetical protein